MKVNSLSSAASKSYRARTLRLSLAGATEAEVVIDGYKDEDEATLVVTSASFNDSAIAFESK